MKSNFELKPFSLAQLDEVIRFAEGNPWKPNWPTDLMQRFLTELSSSTTMTMDIQQNGVRKAVGVLVDKVTNRGNNATFEILGIDPHAVATDLIELLIASAINLVPPMRSGVEFTFHDATPLPGVLINKFNLIPYYETFEMVRDGLAKFEFRARTEYEMSAETDYDELYRVLVESFRENVDTSIPEFVDWRAAQKRTHDSRTFLSRVNGRITGFLTLLTPPDGIPEIRTIGVLPNARGQGFGRDLLQWALQHAATLGYDRCSLTVSVENRNALDLYRKLLFREIEHYQVYRWIRPTVSEKLSSSP